MYFVSGEELALWRAQARTNYPSPQEVDWLLLQISDLDSLSLRLETFRGRSQIPLKFPLPQLTELWQKRSEYHYPLQYLCGTAPWRNFVLEVSPAVLIPRPETEQIIDTVAENCQNLPEQGIWVDLGTGSGAIALGLAQLLTNSLIYAVDASPEALSIAQANARLLGLETRVKFRLGQWWQPLAELQGKITGMVSNPPYIPTDLIPHLQPEVALFEPHLALDGGEDGLDSIRYLVKTGHQYLQSGGLWLLEMMAGQSQLVVQLLEEEQAYKNIQIINDFAGNQRFALAFKR